MASITLNHIDKTYDDGFHAIKDVNLEIEDGEFVILVGPSGSGKSTLLRMIVGLEDITDGEMLIDGRRVNEAAPKDRNLAMVFQNYALYPHLTVYENIAFPLRLIKEHKPSEEEIDRKVRDAARVLELEDHLERKPGNLSGGQRQRVAMGRAIVRDPQVFLMDEPLSNLDAKLRVQTRAQIANLTRRLGTTTVYVTHDQTEAMTMGDRVAVLKEGRLQQVDTPRNLYERPMNVFVAGFIGSPAMNIFRMPATHEGVHWGETVIPVPREDLADAGTAVDLGVRPENLVVSDDAAGLPVEVDTVEELGADAYVYGHATIGGEERLITLRTVGYTAPEKGSVVHVVPDPERVHLFHAETGERLNR